VLQGQVYSAMPGRSGSVMTVGTFFSVLGAGLPFAVGAAAQAFGLGTAMWLLILGPVALLIGLPRRSSHFSDSPIDPDAA
jgi:FSR family fosmidomycin resistance protein-like MFS transporter